VQEGDKEEGTTGITGPKQEGEKGIPSATKFASFQEETEEIPRSFVALPNECERVLLVLCHGKDGPAKTSTFPTDAPHQICLSDPTAAWCKFNEEGHGTATFVRDQLKKFLQSNGCRALTKMETVMPPTCFDESRTANRSKVDDVFGVSACHGFDGCHRIRHTQRLC
jgi:hypothetical protein